MLPFNPDEMNSKRLNGCCASFFEDAYITSSEVVGFYWTDTGSVIVNPERDGSVAISL